MIQISMVNKLMARVIITLVLIISSINAISQDTLRIAKDSTTLTSQQMFDKGNEYYEKKQYDKSIIWLRKSASMENVGAICRLGYMYSMGYGVPIDYNEAVRLTRIAANEGYGKAEYNMAYFYGIGQGVDSSMRKSVKWYKKSAGHGYAFAQADLGSLYI